MEKGSLVETYKKGKGFNKNAIQQSFWGGISEKDKNSENKNVLNKIFEDIGFLESDQYLIEDLQNQLKTQRKFLENSGLEIDQQTKINEHLTKRLKNAILNKESLEREIEEYKKPILYVEDKYDQIYKIAYLKVKNIICDQENYDEIFKEAAPFIIRRTEGAGKLAGRLRSSNNDGYEDKKIIGLFDFDKEGRENIHQLKKESFWGNDYLGDLLNGFYRKRNDHECFYALLLPIPQELSNFASLDWGDFISYVEVENLLPERFLIDNSLVLKEQTPGGQCWKIKKNTKANLWKKLFELPIEGFKNFEPLFNRIMELYKI